MIRLLWHLWALGHSVRVNRGITVGFADSSAKGWLYTCECGVRVAQ
jgi:hypothetical protein